MIGPASSPESAGVKSKLVRFAKELYTIWIAERPTQFAAALAYYAIFSFVPVIYIAFSLADFLVARLSVSDRFYAEVANLLGEEIALALQGAVANVAERTAGGTTLTTVIGFLALAFTASLLFFQLQHTLNTIWRVPLPSRDQTLAYVRNRLLAFAMVLGVVLLLIVASVLNLIVSFISSRLPWSSLVSLGNAVALLALLALSFALIYKALPNAKVGWKEVWLGAGAAALLITVGLSLVKLYFSAARFSTALEAAGAVAVFLMAFYYLGQIFVLGAVLIRVYASMFGSGIAPRSGG
jgi:membrane protein